MSNIQSQIISSKSSARTGMDFKKLVKQGQEIIQKLSGEAGGWTNYNTSDPGITILEHLCYAITDLSYRLSFPVKDLLAENPNEKNVNQKEKILFTAKEILTVNPLTINDYRKLLIDIPEVKNAWIELVEKDSIKGLYKVTIEPHIPILKIEDTAEIKTIVRSKLLKHRNLCEDFDEIIVLTAQEININVDIEIADNINIESLKNKLCKTISQVISPNITFYSLEELKAQGKSIEEIFEGPILEHGFIDDEELKRFDKQSVIYVADIIEAVHKLKGVTIVKKFLIKDFQLEESLQIICKNKALQIKEIEINLYNNGYLINNYFVQEADTLFKDEDTLPKKTDWTIQPGKYRNLAKYISVQEDFPHNYLLGTNNIINDEKYQHIAIQTKQLKAYLLIFDQILANYFAQADDIKILFNYIEDLKEESNKAKSNTSLSQLINYVGIKSLITNQEEYENVLKGMSENSSIRKNRLLDYLLAIFGETFKDYSIPIKRNDNSNNKISNDILEKTKLLSEQQVLINKKITCLTKYPRLSGLRGKAINYTVWNNSQEASCTLEECLSNILGLSINQFYLIEHILLRPTTKTEKSDALLEWIKSPYSGQISLIFPLETVLSKKDIEKNIKKIKEVIRNEAPVHLTIHYHWWNSKKITELKSKYQAWKEAITKEEDNQPEFDTIRNEIIKLLFGKGIGSMVIGKNINSENYYYFTVFDQENPYY